VKHGLGSKTPLLLPGEDPEVWENFISEWFAALVPTSIPEGTMVAQLGDLAWKLERLARIEHGHTLRTLEEIVMQTQTAKAMLAARRARVAVSGLLRVFDECAPPTSNEGLEPLLDGVSALHHFVKDIDGVPAGSTAAMIDALHRLARSTDAAELKAAFLSIGNSAHELSRHLSDAEEQLESALNTEREKLAAERLLVPDPEQRRYARYRESLEKAMAREFELLNQVREQRPDATVDAGQDPQEVRVRLRLVK